MSRRTIEAGEVIIAEEPLLVVHTTNNEDILDELVNSSDEVKAEIMRLSDLGDLDLGCADFFSSLSGCKDGGEQDEDARAADEEVEGKHGGGARAAGG